jgi:hypothetical protein
VDWIKEEMKITITFPIQTSAGGKQQVVGNGNEVLERIKGDRAE